MPEGPSVILFKEELKQFVGQKILKVSGSAKIDKQRLVGKKIKRMKTWGKHLLWEFDDFSIRLHYLMFGVHFINSSKKLIPRLHLQFEKDVLNLYTMSIVLLNEPLNKVYDWDADVLNKKWDVAKAVKKLKAIPDTLVADALLDQTIFAGVGNIIKNEVLYRIKLHPKSLVGNVPPKKLKEMIAEASNYSHDFLKWKRAEVLKKNWHVYTKKICKRDKTKIKKEYIGKTKRRTFYCPTCQKKYE